MTTQLTYEEIQQGARCGWMILDLARILEVEHPGDMAGSFGDLDASDYKHLGEMLGGIEIVLDMLGRTPNAYVNREALDAMAEYVEQARKHLAQDWVIELMGRKDVRLETVIEDVLPF